MTRRKNVKSFTKYHLEYGSAEWKSHSMTHTKYNGPGSSSTESRMTSEHFNKMHDGHKRGGYKESLLSIKNEILWSPESGGELETLL